VEAELSLPDNIMLDFEDPATKLALSKIHKEKKQKWVPVQAVRQSSWIDRSKNIMEKAKERKRKANLDIPKMKGIMCSNLL
jgi:type I restriction-modification system DNA methylase subunit